MRAGAGEQKYESNARFVRWSDGSLQLVLGEEVLDTTNQDLARDHHYLFVRHQGLIQAPLTRPHACCLHAFALPPDRMQPTAMQIALAIMPHAPFLAGQGN